jgi:hypothetical protein
MACTFDLLKNGCFLEITEQPSGELARQINLSTVTWTERSDDDIAIRDGDGNTFNADIDQVNGYATIALLIADLDAWRASCTLVPSGGGAPTPTEVTATYNRTEETGAGTTTANIYGLVVTNIGAASGTFGGVTLAVGQTEVVNKTFNEATGEVLLVPAIAFDATGTTFTIAELS